ncbi:hypothetical protein MAR_018397 [Mya arenaria]|uniref:EGF-like domain-containing protein n=1 Tax=Mya arenaria TaxID=6604 RepID=A0ABY7EH88_MYAAR|nr:hypothetical protein MAR_018397 [Mya arenaria]
MFGSDTPCKGQNTKCDYGSNKCVCIDTYVIDDVIMECVCPSGYREVNSWCTNDGMPGGFCNSSVPCIVEGSVCNSVTSTCECDASQNLTLHDGECIPAGNLHGYCDTHTVCVDPNTECRDNTCVCSAGFSDIQGECLQDGMPGGSCLANKQCTLNTTRCSYLTGLCECVGNFTAVGGICVEDGSNGGVCLTNATSTCNDVNAECNSDRCRYQQPGGRCSPPTLSCLSNLTECSEGICRCITSYTLVNGDCENDGSISGVCKSTDVATIGDCDDVNAMCVDDDTGQCAGTNCKPGICRCKAGYKLGSLGQCAEECATDSDCLDANANCHPTLFVCECSLQYTLVKDACVGPGEVGGECRSTLGSECDDVHAVCLDGKCTCNDVRHYVIKDGKCVKNDTYTNGLCGQNKPCRDSNAHCQSGTCVCKANYVSVNGRCVNDGNNAQSCDSDDSCPNHAQCVEGQCACAQNYVMVHGVCVKSNSSVISSCEGDSPYNTLQPECPSGKTAVITDAYTMVAMRAACPPKMDVYSSTLFEQCCTPNSTDCRLDAPGCMQGSFSTYDVVEYTCVDDSAVIGHEDDDSVSGNPVYVVSPGGHTESGSGSGTSASLCHVRADCKTTLYVYVVYMEQV